MVNNILLIVTGVVIIGLSVFFGAFFFRGFGLHISEEVVLTKKGLFLERTVLLLHVLLLFFGGLLLLSMSTKSLL